jgi:hypothetical protein
MRNFANVGRRTISNKAVSKKISIGSAGEVDLTDVQSVVINLRLRPVDATVSTTLTAELAYASGPEANIHHGSRIAEWQYESR